MFKKGKIVVYSVFNFVSDKSQQVIFVFIYVPYMGGWDVLDLETW